MIGYLSMSACDPTTSKTNKQWPVSCERDSFAKGKKSLLQRRKTWLAGEEWRLPFEGKKMAAHMTRANIKCNDTSSASY
jgi:hypothetical protein